MYFYYDNKKLIMKLTGNKDRYLYKTSVLIIRKNIYYVIDYKIDY